MEFILSFEVEDPTTDDMTRLADLIDTFQERVNNNNVAREKEAVEEV